MTKHKPWLAGAILMGLWACGSSPEQATVEQFLLAAKSEDSPTMAAMSAVGSPGTVESWKVVEISSQSSAPFAMPELVVQLEPTEKIRDAALKEGRDYLEENQVALDEILRKQKQDPEFKFSGEKGKVQEEWAMRVEKRKATERDYKEIERAVNRETTLANKSVVRDVTVENLDGDVSVTEMLVMIKLEDADEKPYAVTLRKYELSSPGSDGLERSRWIIVDIQEKSPT